LRQYDEALLNYDAAIALNPDYAEAISNRGNAFLELNRYDEALWNYERAITINPDNAEAYSNRGSALLELKRYEEAIESYEKAILMKPEGVFWFGMYLHAKMRICDWSHFESQYLQLVQKITCHKKASTPFPVLALIDSPLLQKKASLIYVEEKYSSLIALPKIPKRSRREKVRIGYYSADYHDHATANLMAELFENHDRRKFELIAFSFGPEKPNSGMRKRITSTFDQFIDVRAKTEKDIALLSRHLEVDIAIDLKGYTQDSRAGIFALRAAPVQVSYLGYPGTMGAEFIDYIIADSTLIPGENQQFYTEKIVYLPDSYQANDAKRQIADKIFSPEELGLPKTGFVFCCFNNSYKITPGTFDCWMRILNQVKGSVLWLLEDNSNAAVNLTQEAVKRGIEKERLIFAKRMPLPEHLARHRLADLFLDTLPCNAHTTASDALWTGLPVLTCTGESFASRVAASLLNAIHLPELVTSTTEEYETLAVELGSNLKKLKALKKKLMKNRLSSPLFINQLLTRYIEKAYMVMYEKYQADLMPENIYITTRL
jgi:predicted O-linked N-acetylglucosamine transferase (SPINDLY family)